MQEEAWCKGQAMSTPKFSTTVRLCCVSHQGRRTGKMLEGDVFPDALDGTIKTLCLLTGLGCQVHVIPFV